MGWTEIDGEKIQRTPLSGKEFLLNWYLGSAIIFLKDFASNQTALAWL
jgi:hypothetical protein